MQPVADPGFAKIRSEKLAAMHVTDHAMANASGAIECKAPKPQSSASAATWHGTGVLTIARGLWFMILFRISKKVFAGKAFPPRLGG